jgi:hypothetical protein
MKTDYNFYGSHGALKQADSSGTRLMTVPLPRIAPLYEFGVGLSLLRSLEGYGIHPCSRMKSKSTEQ